MNYLIIGAGAIGTYLGVSLMDAGCQVTIVERDEASAQLRKDGITLEKLDGSVQRVFPSVAENIIGGLAQKPDVVIFAMKSFDTAAAASQLRDQLSLFKVVLCLQNGVENEAVIAEVVGGGKVMTGSISSAVERTGLGQARLERLRGIGIGSQHPLAGALFTDFQAAALKPMLIRDASAMKWTKMLSNLLGNATAAILDMPPGAIFAHPVGYQIERRQILEAITVMRKMGIRVINLPGTPMVWLKRLMLIFPAGLARPVLAKVMGSGRGNKMPSFHIDLHAGRPRLESGYLNGAVVRFGKRVGVETPVNAALDQLLQELIGRPDLQAEYKANPEKLFAYIRQFSASGKAGA